MLKACTRPVCRPVPGQPVAVTLLAHTLNASLAILVPGENDLRKSRLESAGASDVVIADELLARVLVDTLNFKSEAMP